MRTATAALARWVLALASACTVPTSVALQPDIEAVEVAPFTRLLIFASLQRGRFHHVYPGFKAALIEWLESCGVEPVVVDVEHRSDLEQVFDRWVARFRPAAVLLIDLESATMSRPLPGLPDVLKFKLKFHDVALGKTIWAAQATLHLGTGPSYDPSQSGMLFATRIIEQLRSDQVLKGCPDRDPR